MLLRCQINQVFFLTFFKENILLFHFVHLSFSPHPQNLYILRFLKVIIVFYNASENMYEDLWQIAYSSFVLPFAWAHSEVNIKIMPVSDRREKNPLDAVFFWDSRQKATHPTEGKAGTSCWQLGRPSSILSGRVWAEPTSCGKMSWGILHSQLLLGNK